MFSGSIRRWSQINVTTNSSIRFVLPSEDSGLTSMITSFLNNADPNLFPSTFSQPSGWPKSLINVAFSKNVADTVSSSSNSIGFTSLNLALEAGLFGAAIINNYQLVSFPKYETLKRTSERSNVNQYNILLLDTTTYKYTYPLISPIHMLVPTISRNCDIGAELFQFYLWLSGSDESSRLLKQFGVSQLSPSFNDRQIDIATYFKCNSSQSIIYSSEVNSQDTFVMRIAGATSVYRLLSLWQSYWNFNFDLPGWIQYNASGSYSALKEIELDTKEMALSDGSLEDHHINSGLVQIPIAAYGVAIIVNIPSLGSENLVLNRETLVDIFSGKITYWDDTDIRKTNEFILLPHEPIRIVIPKQSSGITNILTMALSVFSDVWALRYGNFSEADNWPSNLNLTTNNTDSDISRFVSDNFYTLGYCSYAQALYEGNSVVMLVNKNDVNVKPSLDFIQEVVNSVQFDSYLRYDPWTLLDSSITNAYPIIGINSYVIRKQMSSKILRKISSHNDGCKVAKALMQFINYTISATNSQDLNYYLLSSRLSSSIMEIIYTITCDGTIIIPRPPKEQTTQINTTAIIISFSILIGMIAISIIAFVFVLMFQKRKLIKTLKDIEYQSRLVKAQKSIYLSLINSLFPEGIASELIQGMESRVTNFAENQTQSSIVSSILLGRQISRSYPQTVVFFSDMVGFTSKAGHISAEELVSTLDAVIGEMDTACTSFGMEKIKTIGDAYLACCSVSNTLGSPLKSITFDDALNTTIKSQYDCDIGPNTSEEAAECALKFGNHLHFLVRKHKIGGQPIILRVGMSYGPIVAGVIGKVRVAYDIWGDTVNVASRMESTGVAGYTQVTEILYHLLKSKYSFNLRNVEAKGIGSINTYLHDPSTSKQEVKTIDTSIKIMEL
eukprot:NODE_96_length_3803_cov_26.898098_g81_i0.p1 GENE.NODE_96_length_3803_cov_26.898098_g81_i0~~NODE_96_length_3803_cov_26.898098_g81_i0.p1  ORF type:complete len:990 (+),score=160.24 NODE_96_length_3803_cov_26.898098_g81_i0:278-2971(+)